MSRSTATRREHPARRSRTTSPSSRSSARRSSPTRSPNPEQIRTMYTTTPVYAGEQLTLKRFAPPSEQGVRAQLTGTQRAFQVSGDATQLLSGTLVAGDTIDVVANMKDPKDNTNIKALVALRDLRVLGVDVDKHNSKLADSSVQDHTVLLGVTDEQAQRLEYIDAERELGARAPAGEEAGRQQALVRQPLDRARRPFMTDGTHLGGSHDLRIVVTGTDRLHADLVESLEESVSGLHVVGTGAVAGDVPSELLADSSLTAIVHGTAWDPADEDAVGGQADLRGGGDRAIRARRSSCSRPRPGPALVEAAFAAGVDDVLVLPQRPETISFAIHKASRAASGRRRRLPRLPRRSRRAAGDHDLLAEGRDGQDRDRHELSAYLASKTPQARAADRPRPAVRRRRDHARSRPERTMHELVQVAGRARSRQAGRIHDAAPLGSRRPRGADAAGARGPGDARRR